MSKKIYNIVKILSIIVTALAGIWLYAAPGFEPAVTFIAGIIGLLNSMTVEQKEQYPSQDIAEQYETESESILPCRCTALNDERDESQFVRDVTIPDGIIVRAGEEFTKIWEIRNSGNVKWANRYLKKLGPCSGPGLIDSPEQVPIPETNPCQNVQIAVKMKAPDCATTTSCQWKMVTADGTLCFPDKYPYGLFVTINVVEK